MLYETRMLEREQAAGKAGYEQGMQRGIKEGREQGKKHEKHSDKNHPVSYGDSPCYTACGGSIQYYT